MNRARSPTCALLDRPGRRIVPQELEYRGVELVDQFVLGYGLHVRDLYRNLPYVVAGDRADVADAPTATSPTCTGADIHDRSTGHGAGRALRGPVVA